MSESEIIDFSKLYANSRNFQISDLIPQYLKLKPLAHPECNTSIYSEGGVEYFLMRLPIEITFSTKIYITANRTKLQKFKNLQDYKQVFAHKRKRLYFFSKKEKTLVIGINSISDLHDIIPILTGLLHEIRKLKTLISGHEEIQNYFSSDHIRKLAEHYRFDVDGVKQHLQNLSKLNDFQIEIDDCDEKFYEQRAEVWMNWLKKSIQDKISATNNIYVIFSNSHSIVNVLSSYTRTHKDELVDWACRQPRFRKLIEKAKDKDFWEDDALYYFERAFLGESPKNLEVMKKENEDSGIFRFEDLNFDGPIFHLINLGELNSNLNDSRIFDNAIDNIKKSKSIIINIDFTMGGHQAYYILSEILKEFENIKGLYIFGKAGSMEGKIGDVILPEFTYDYYQSNYIFYKNDLKSKYLRRYLRNGDILESHGMLTVPGVLLQNYDYLNYYFRQSLTGIEMEGGAYLDAIIEKMCKKTFTGEILHLSKFPFDFGIAYYVSDTPYHEGKTLGTLDQAGLESVYSLSVAVINRILIKESCREIF